MFSLPRQWGAKSISFALAAIFVLVMLSGAAFAQTENGQINGKLLTLMARSFPMPP